jgi:hypothetical protein
MCVGGCDRVRWGKVYLLPEFKQITPLKFACIVWFFLTSRSGGDSLLIRHIFFPLHIETKFRYHTATERSACTHTYGFISYGVPKKIQFLPYSRSIGSWICLKHKMYTCHTVQNTYSASMAVSDSQ